MARGSMDESKNIEESLNDIKRYLNEIRNTTSHEVSIKDRDIERINETIKSSSVKFSYSSLIVLIIAIVLGLMVYYMIGSDLSEEYRILTVSFSSFSEEVERSDCIQVENALKYGGQIIVLNENDGYEYAFGREYERYGALNGSNMYYTRGAVLNYIASKGWNLVEAPTTGLSDNFYFSKPVSILTKMSSILGL